MSPIEVAIDRPVAVAVGVLLVALFGLLALAALPVQLTPEVTRPQLTVSTQWPGAAPAEVEREIVQRQEDALKGVEGVVEMRSESRDGSGRVVLTFRPGSDMDAASLRVSNHLSQVRTAPVDAERPVISTVNTENQAIAWFALRTLPGNTEPVDHYQRLAEDLIKARFERVPGVARSNVFGGRDRELQVLIDPTRLAAHGVTVAALAATLARESVNRSAGTLDEGKRRYRVRTVGELTTPQKVARVAIATAGGERITVGDIATTRLAYARATSVVHQNGVQAIALNCLRAPGANVIEVMAGLKRAVAELNAGPLADRGLILEQVYDETGYIRAAIHLVVQNVWLGGSLAIGVLLLFLRAVRPTAVVAVSIPISVMGTFLVMRATGRTLNVISLAGLAFATGMVVDNAIVVLENIFRHHQQGESPAQAALEGTREVWGAVLASTLTTIAVFLPILFVAQEAGQLFRDLAIAICGAVGFSLIVSVTVIPSLAALLLSSGRADRAERRGAPSRVAAAIGGAATTVSRRPLLRLATLTGLTAVAVALAVALAPPPEYLPTGNRNLLIAMLLPPPGMNLAELQRISDGVERDLAPLWGDDATARHGAPAIANFFSVTSPRRLFMGLAARDPSRVRELIPVVRARLAREPGMIAVVTQASLFGRVVSGGRAIDLAITGSELEPILDVARDAYGRLRERLPGAQVRPTPGLELGNPELRLTPKRLRLADLGMSARDLALTVDAVVDGVRATTVRVDGEEIDLRLTGDPAAVAHTQTLARLPIRTPGGRIVPIGDLATLRLAPGPAEIHHLERERAITLQVRPPRTVPLAAAMTQIRDEVITPLREEGRLGGAVRAHLSGTADRLRTTFDVVKGNFALAVAITYLLMAALFDSFLFPVAILFSVPLAVAGGFLGLWLVSHLIAYQALDMLTMVGFILLAGTVVNNAILIVHRALQLRRGGVEPHAALGEAVTTRVRPIFMSVATTVTGMLPLILFPGAGSELYRGLGGVVVGGLIVSTLFTLVLVPAAFSLLTTVGRRGYDAR